MSSGFELSVEVSEPYKFSKESLGEIESNKWVVNQWPVVYFISDQVEQSAYVGESTNFGKRVKDHLKNDRKSKLKQLSIIGSDKFNKSVTLDIESKLIQYISAEGSFQLLNGNFGLINHNYYQQDLYSNLFKEIWTKLVNKKIVTKSLQEIENSELFKYSPYKSLSEDQYNSVIELLEALTSKSKSKKIMVNGSAGTGKTILATYLLKLLYSNTDSISREDLNENEVYELQLLQKFKRKYPVPKIAIVVAMTSLRTSLQNVFKKIPDLKTSMVISPSESFKKDYDLLIVDEAHRLRQYKSIGWRGAFKKNNRKLGLDDSGTELDWIIANSKNQILFYDEAQSVKPSDIDSSKFKELLKDPGLKRVKLKSQMRCKGGADYITYIDKLLKCKLGGADSFESSDYSLIHFDSMQDLYERLTEKENEFGLCRMIAGYAWEWKSDPKRKPPALDLNAVDIELDGLEFQWNREAKDWINSDTAFDEIGCIHTTQGYDLNYAGIIFGWEIDYDPINNKMVIDKAKYFDKYGKIGANSDVALREYIVNIYKTILYRGIRGAYVYACNKNLRDYLAVHIGGKEKKYVPRILPIESVIPYVNSVPLYDLKIAASDFSDTQSIENHDWVELPSIVSARKGYFVCQVIGESMNKLIPNGSWCLFEQYTGGSRNGLTVLVQHSSFVDSEFGAGYTIKEYRSEKRRTESGWEHSVVQLIPKSNDSAFEIIELQGGEMDEFVVIGVFQRILK